MLAWVFLAAMAVLALATIRRARAGQPSSHALPPGHPLESAIALGVALGAMAAAPTRADPVPWIHPGGVIAIPIAAALIGLGLRLARAHTPAEPFAPPIPFAIAAAILAAIAHTAGLTLSQGAAIGLGLGAWAWLRPRSIHPRPFHTGFVRTSAPVLLVCLCGLPAIWLGAPPRIVWTTVLAAFIALGAAADSHEPSTLGLLGVVTPLGALAMYAVMDVLGLAAATGSAYSIMGEHWLVGVAETLATRPTAPLPSGFTPEICAIAAAWGVALCAPRLHQIVRQTLGWGVILLGAAIAASALAP